MKEKLVIAFFWLAVINFALQFAEDAFDNIGLDPLGWLFGFGAFFVTFVMAIVGVRLLCEIAIAIFRINDNLSPDGGKSETADIDPIHEALKAAEEARRAAEEAARKATAATRSAVNRNKTTSETDEDNVEAEIIEPAPNKPIVKKPAAKKAVASKAAVKKPAAKKTAVKKSAAKKASAKKPAAKSAASHKNTPRPETD